ncbi:hypothetical protein L0664_06465 [Octadecabacter sp. G9-8]|uniref:Uncharacterized protein n=1 Tax=Octadecabacter dasysiphoniae TaxID=2909341 RepID=A0ABS9CWE3_9RHOB|nr:hypothetical protein [Octadecabacter dasysiphoniae]MCF2870704.1 hypothetical protein [Octadecabacter dasysiphoniae]
MLSRSTMLPVALAVVIGFLTLMAISSGRSDAPGVVGDSDYPHYICTFNEYCEGDTCTSDPSSFVLYTEHVDLKPRLELARVNPDVSVTKTATEHVYETRGGVVSGTLTFFSDRTLYWEAASGPASTPIEHYATGRCERLRSP